MASPRVLVLALNPAMDVEWRVDRVLPEEKNDVRSERRWPGGKGINVARWLAHLQCDATLLPVIAGPTGAALLRGCREWGLRVRPFRLPGDSRANIIVTAAAGGQWRFNHAGPRASAADFRRLQASLSRASRPGGIVVFSGSRTPGLPESTYRILVRQATRAGTLPVLDCEGPSLAAAVRSRPHLVKPNEHELATWAGRALADDETLRQAALDLSCATRGWVLLSRGGEGAWLLHSGLGLAWTAHPPRESLGPVRNTVGAGDAALAGAVAAMAAKKDPEEWLRWAVAAGSACVTQPGGTLPSRPRIRHCLGGVSVTPLALAGKNP